MESNPGCVSLTQNGVVAPFNADLSITTAQTIICNEIDGFDGMLGCLLEARFAYGSGGTSVDLYLQTCLDDSGTVWCDIWHESFTTASDTKVVNLSALTPVTTPYAPLDGALASNTVKDGILGNRLRSKVVIIGTYAGSTALAVRATPR